MSKLKIKLTEVSALTGLELTVIETWIANEWVTPTAPESLDEEDVARLRLIHELQQDFGVNEEAVPLILHLVDQLCFFREQVRNLPGDKE